MDPKYLRKSERGWHAATIPTAKRIAAALETPLAERLRQAFRSPPASRRRISWMKVSQTG
jgi:hypothetical protein